MTDMPDDTTPVPGPDGQAEAEPAPAAELDELRGALAELDGRYRRLAADFENFRRRSAQEAQDRARYGAELLALALIPVLDNLQRAQAHAPEGDPLLDGLRMVTRQFQDALSSAGITPIDAEGQPFDPALHEAIGGEESADVEHDTVLTVLQPGYRLHDRVLRPALVRVAHPVAG
jgi:molecular chaperone GrpE